MRINDILVEFAPSGDSGGSGNYFQALASAWYNGTFDTGSLQKGIKSQQDVERLLQRGVLCPDGVTRKLHIDYNSDFDGVEIYSDDYYEYGDYDDTIDSRTGQKWGPYDFMAFSDEDLSEGINEFAADDGDSGGEDDALHKYARMWWAGDEATQMQIEKVLARMGWEIGEDEGGYDNGGVFVVRAGDVNGNSYVSWAAEDLSEGLTEVDRRGFLKGLGAAAVAGAAGGADAYSRYPKAIQYDERELQIISTFLLLRQFCALDSRLYARYMDRIKTAIGEFVHNAGVPPESQKDILSQQQRIVANQYSKLEENPQELESYKKYYTENASGIIRVFTQIVNEWDDAPKPKNIKPRESVEQGVAEGGLNEKSTSQAQFRTMAAAAHDPAFASKVGIKQSVAREFNRADKKSNYKSLPKKAD